MKGLLGCIKECYTRIGLKKERQNEEAQRAKTQRFAEMFKGYLENEYSFVLHDYGYAGLYGSLRSRSSDKELKIEWGLSRAEQDFSVTIKQITPWREFFRYSEGYYVIYDNREAVFEKLLAFVTVLDDLKTEAWCKNSKTLSVEEVFAEMCRLITDYILSEVLFFSMDTDNELRVLSGNRNQPVS